jgi:hypothetical protein
MQTRSGGATPQRESAPVPLTALTVFPQTLSHSQPQDGERRKETDARPATRALDDSGQPPTGNPHIGQLYTELSGAHHSGGGGGGDGGGPLSGAGAGSSNSSGSGSDGGGSGLDAFGLFM